MNFSASYDRNGEMDSAFPEPGSNQIELALEDLSHKEKETLIALLTSKSDTEAIAKSPVGKTQYYAYKKKLQPIKEKLSNELTLEALRLLKANSIDAAEVLTSLLKSYNQNVKLKAAVEVLDRTVGGKPEIVNKQITQIGIIGVTQEDLQKLVEPED